jgi:hypothetical protein
VVAVSLGRAGVFRAKAPVENFAAAHGSPRQEPPILIKKLE